MKITNVLILAICLSTLLTFQQTQTCRAREFEHGIHDSRIERPEREETAAAQGEYYSMIATAYCLTGSTATGTVPRSGIAAAKPSWFGKCVKIYQNSNGKPGNLIGTYIVEDTGDTPIRNGSVIDIWIPTEEECFEFGRRSVLVRVMDQGE